MSSGDASGKPWMPSVLAENRARFDAKARDLDLEFFDRNGEPMRPADWIEANVDPDYVLIDTDQLGDIRISTTWVGIHIPDHPGWDRVIFGIQVVDLTSETLARLASQPAAEERPDEPFDVLSIHDPRYGEIVFRGSYQTLAEAERGHRLVVAAVTAAKIGPRPTGMQPDSWQRWRQRGRQLRRFRPRRRF